MNTTNKLTLLIFLAVVAIAGCKQDIPFNPNIHTMTATIDGEAWQGTARAYVEPTKSILNPTPTVENHLSVGLKHIFPNQIDIETLIMSLPAEGKVDCYPVRTRSYSEHLSQYIGQKAYFYLAGSELDGVRELYNPDTAHAEISTICITRYSSEDRIVEGSFDLYLRTEDGFPQYEDANRPGVFSILDGKFKAHLTE